MKKKATIIKRTLTLLAGLLLTSAQANEAVALPAAIPESQAVSLAGNWRCEIAGTNSAGCAREPTGKIRLQGTIDDAGLGPKNTAAPTLKGPNRTYDYAGPVWYQHDIDTAASWRGQRMTLFLERCGQSV
jgi:hypothetical protein